MRGGDRGGGAGPRVGRAGRGVADMLALGVGVRIDRRRNPLPPRLGPPGPACLNAARVDALNR